MPNRLANATSPYLLQHQDNPVDWWEWGGDAFDEARRRDVPVLLSVGYAACHWCHVMAHESFEDPETAGVMNERYVNIKVDREERPDVDSIYMEAVQAMTGQGGWPMTVWLDHDGRPFFAGTYFPKDQRHGMASFSQVMDAVSTAWEERREDVSEQAGKLVEAISREIPAGDVPDRDQLVEAYAGVEATFDPANGGFGGAPKFPQQPVLEFLLRIHRESWAPRATTMLTETLDEMADGGIHDQIGGGFARYSVDAHWLVPHFEKMLYDNAQLARLYLWAGIELDRPEFVDIARSTLDYMARELRHAEGGFFSSEDADSEGEEGKFYVWTVDELRAALGDRAEDAITYFGATEAGNFEGANILQVAGVEPPAGLREIESTLLEARSRRVRPGLDDKVIASWNGLAIRAFAEAGAALDDQRYLNIAEQAATFVTERLVVDGTLMRAWREGRTSGRGFLDDHAGMAMGLFTLYSATGDERWYEQAIGLVNLLGLFVRPDGGFYSNSNDDADDLVKRPTDVTDNPLPSGNALAAESLLTASLFTANEQWRQMSESALASIGLLADRYPSMVGHHLAVAHSSASTRELAIVGEGWRHLAAVYWSRYRPEVALAPSEAGSETVPLLEGRTAEGDARAFVCRGFVCDLPTSDPDILADQLA
ncbi:MAG TPA: thioredoxin domain-containing protein [Acidimicrobiia bacterium]|nr:thioredoxin domain-containing protein [Acidimicrobiia bacterium]